MRLRARRRQASWTFNRAVPLYRQTLQVPRVHAIMRKPPLVEITWLDACDLNGQAPWEPGGQEIGARFKLKERQTVGLLVYQAEDRTILAHDYDKAEPTDEDQRPLVGNLTVVPTGWVTKLRYIERRPKPHAETSAPKA